MRTLNNLGVHVKKLLDHAAVRDGHVGVVAGIVDGDTITIESAGRTSKGRSPDGDTLFRIASISKVVTGTALAAKVVRRELRLEDPLRDGSPIRLEHLVTHRSGLPRNGDPDESTEPDSPPGTTFAYSNLGASLVGRALTEGGSVPYDAMLRETLPWLSGDIVEHPDREQRERCTGGHDAEGVRCETPTYPAAVASGGLWGTARGLLEFLRRHWNTDDPALRLATTPRAGAMPGNRIGVFWLIGELGVWHNGNLPGFGSIIAMDIERRRGVVALTNTAKPIDPIAARLIEK